MKILLWPTTYFPLIGGLEKMVHCLAVELLRRNHEVRVICNSEKIETFSIEKIPVFTFPFLNALFKYRLTLIGEILKEVNRILDDFSPDVVNIHGWSERFSFYQTRVLEKRPIPVCLTIHGLLGEEDFQKEHCEKLWKRAQAVNTVSDSTIPSKPHPYLQTIYNGLPLPKTPLQPLPKNRLLLVGRLSKEKCFHVAFYAFKILLCQHLDLHLTLIGNGFEYKALFELKQSLSLPIDMPGFKPPNEVQDYIDRSTLVIIPSSYESFSLVALEAALRGRPVVASRVFGLREVVEDQKTGILVEPENPEELAAAIHKLLSHPAQMEKMGKYARERASRLFNIETTVNRYVNMYEQATHLYHHCGS